MSHNKIIQLSRTDKLKKRDLVVVLKKGRIYKPILMASFIHSMVCITIKWREQV
jgi:hypothetical protein